MHDDLRNMIRAKIQEEMDTWVVGEVPSTVQEGVKHAKEQLHQVLVCMTGDSNPQIEVWQKYDDHNVVRFEYIYMDGHTAVFGWYLINTRFWEPRLVEDPEPYEGEDACFYCKGTKIYTTCLNGYTARCKCFYCFGSGKKTTRRREEDTHEG